MTTTRRPGSWCVSCHTSGFEGHIFTDTGVGDDCVEKYLSVLHDVPQLFPPGEMFSCNNAGFCVLGRLVEVLRESTYDECLKERIFAPLGLTHAATGPYDAILHRSAVGHIELEPGAGYQPAVWAMARSNSPAGSMHAPPAAIRGHWAIIGMLAGFEGELVAEGLGDHLPEWAARPGRDWNAMGSWST